MRGGSGGQSPEGTLSACSTSTPAHAVSKTLDPFGAWLARPASPRTPSPIIGTVGATASALIFFTQGWWFSGTLVIWGFVMLDILDGAVARASGKTTKFGGVLDSTGDRIADAAIFGSLAWYFARHDQPWMLAAALLCLVLGSLTSYIRARAEGRRPERYGRHRRAGRTADHRAGGHRAVGGPSACAVRAGHRAVDARGGVHDHRRAAAGSRVAAVAGRRRRHERP